jgi:hypothetical protein
METSGSHNRSTKTFVFRLQMRLIRERYGHRILDHIRPESMILDDHDQPHKFTCPSNNLKEDTRIRLSGLNADVDFRASYYCTTVELKIVPELTLTIPSPSTEYKPPNLQIHFHIPISVLPSLHSTSPSPHPHQASHHVRPNHPCHPLQGPQRRRSATPRGPVQSNAPESHKGDPNSTPQPFSSNISQDGKPYIVSVQAGKAKADQRAQGFTIVAISTFASQEDFNYYDTQCAAHLELRTFAKGVNEGFAMIYFENEVV